MRSGAFKNLCHIQIYTVKWTYEPIWESIFSVFWASGVLKSIFPDLSAPKEARETKKIHLKFVIQKGLPPTWETTVEGEFSLLPMCLLNCSHHMHGEHCSLLSCSHAWWAVITLVWWELVAAKSLSRYLGKIWEHTHVVSLQSDDINTVHFD